MINMNRLVQILLCVTVSFIYILHAQLTSQTVKSVITHTYIPERPITVVTYNIQYGKGQDGRLDLQRTIQTLLNIDADIVCLQEVERFSIRSHFTDQVEIIARQLGMNYVFTPTVTFPGFYYGHVILSKYPITETFYLKLDSIQEKRAVAVAEIHLGNRPIYVINTHLGLNKGERQTHIDLIENEIRTIDAPILLTGDLNSIPSQKEYAPWSHTLTKSNEGIVLQTYNKREWQIDYIFFSEHFNVLNTYNVLSDASDHFPLVSVFIIK